MLDDPLFVSAQYQTTDALQARIALHERFSTATSSWTTWLFDQLPLSGQGHLLEVGCGSGDLWVENRHRLPTGWTFYLSDLHAAMVHQARHRLGQLENWEYVLADAQAVPFVRAEFDLVVANHMLYHVADLDQALEDLAGVLKPGGWLVAATNGPKHMLELDQLTTRFLPESCFVDDAALPSFNLENGTTWIRNHFEEAEVRRHPTGLRVTEVEPLLAYVHSCFEGRPAIRQEALDSMMVYLEQHIAQHGAFHITKEVGCILGRRR